MYITKQPHHAMLDLTAMDGITSLNVMLYLFQKYNVSVHPISVGLVVMPLHWRSCLSDGLANRDHKCNQGAGDGHWLTLREYGVKDYITRWHAATYIETYIQAVRQTHRPTYRRTERQTYI